MTLRRLGLLLACLGLWAAAAGAAPIAPRASLTDIESRVMCVTCGVPLSIAESPAADSERAYIRQLIAQGKTTTQIMQALVGQLGPEVLALPQSRGFNLAVYIVPVALIGILAAMLAVALPRWRRRGGPPPGQDPPGGAGAELTDADAARLEADLARYAG